MKNKPIVGLFLIYSAWAPVMAQMSSGFPTPLIQNVMNAPNPFDSRRGGLEGQTQISYSLLENADVFVTIYDLFGQRIQEWRFGTGDTGGRAGDNQFLWDGTNQAGQKVSKGGYLARIEVRSASGSTATIRKIGVIH